MAVPDPRTAGVTLTEDGFGIVAGFPDAPLQVEIFTEPQCSHCADLQARYGEEMKAAMEAGRLTVTYRPLTFLDDEYLTDYSATASNTLFLAVDSATDTGTDAATFQNYVEELWANQDLSFFDFTDQDFADIATDSGLPDAVVTRIADGDTAVDTDALLEFNFTALENISPNNLGTPWFTTSAENRWWTSPTSSGSRRCCAELDPLLQHRETHQCRGGHQPADNGHRRGRHDGQQCVAVLHPNQIRVGPIVFDVDPHTVLQLGRIQHTELGTVGHPVRGDEFDGGPPRPGVEDLSLGDTHVGSDRQVIAPGPGDQEHRLQRHQHGDQQYRHSRPPDHAPGLVCDTSPPGPWIRMCHKRFTRPTETPP